MAAKVRTLRSLTWTILLIYTVSCLFAERLSLCTAQKPANSIKAGEALRYSDKLLVSSNGRFQLGFFNASLTMNGFLGIRYTNVYENHMVWVANRDAPFYGVNATLVMDSDGNLKIVTGGGDGTIPVNVDGKSPNSTATLENSGNLVVRSETNRVVWESFDHPTDTLLPGMKLGSSHVSKKKWVLTSGISEDNPGTGAFTLEFNSRDSREAFEVRRRGHPYSANGPALVEDWVDDQRSYFSNENETYFNLTAGKGVVDLHLRIDSDGRITRGDRNNGVTLIGDCNAGLSFAFECAGMKIPVCRSGGDAFVLRGRFVYDASESTQYSDDNSSVVVSDCFERCVRDCSCVGFSTLYPDQTGCNFWREGARFELSDIFGDVFVLNSSYPIPDGKSGSFGYGHKWWIWVVISAMTLMV